LDNNQATNLPRRKYFSRPFLIGIGVAASHFLITIILKQVSDYRDSIGLIFTAPSLILLLPLYYLVSYTKVAFLNSFFQLLMIPISSLWYGLLGGLLVSGRWYLRLICIILGILSIIFGIFLGYLAIFVAG